MSRFHVKQRRYFRAIIKNFWFKERWFVDRTNQKRALKPVSVELG